MSLEGRLVVWWSPSIWYLHLVPCTWYLVPCTWHLVPCTWCKHLVTQYLTAPTWLPHNSCCLSISVHCRPTRVSSTDQGGRAVSGPRILSFQSQKKPKKNKFLGSILGSATNEISGLIISVLPPFFHDEDSILYYAY